jgi:hypothetical protein
MIEAVLNEAQAFTLAEFLTGTPGSPGDFPVDLNLELRDGTLKVNDLWLHEDGEWATFHPADETPNQ